MSKVTNYEYFKDEIIDLIGRGDRLAVVHGKPKNCSHVRCAYCDLCPGNGNSCKTYRKKWLEAEHIEKPKLTKKERQFCELVETGWIARDESGVLYYSINKPVKVKVGGRWLEGMKYIDIYDIFASVLNHSFSFITWDDAEPWSVEELLKLEVEE